MASQPFHGLIFKINAALYGDVPEYLTFTERAQLHASYRLISLHQTFSPMWKGIFG